MSSSNISPPRKSQFEAGTAAQALKANPIHSDVLVYWKSIGQKSKTQEIFSHRKLSKSNNKNIT